MNNTSKHKLALKMYEKGRHPFLLKRIIYKVCKKENFSNYILSLVQKYIYIPAIPLFLSFKFTISRVWASTFYLAQ